MNIGNNYAMVLKYTKIYGCKFSITKESPISKMKIFLFHSFIKTTHDRMYCVMVRK